MDDLKSMSAEDLLAEYDDAVERAGDVAEALWYLNNNGERPVDAPCSMSEAKAEAEYESCAARLSVVTAEVKYRMAYPPPGHVRMPDGRDIEHPMWQTLDSAWVIEGDRVWHPDFPGDTDRIDDNGEEVFQRVTVPGEIDTVYIPAAQCYSTPEAAKQAAEKAGEVGNG